MRAVRRAVSKNKARFVDASLDVDLDLSYVLPGRVAAMGVPAVSWWHAAYRNPAGEVARLLAARHGGQGGGAPRIYDLCSEHWSSATDETDGAYAPSDLLSEDRGGAVVRAPMDDHQAPPLQGVARVVADAAAWLARHEDNAVFVHCKAGKGRSGVVVCCLLLHLWMAAEEALGENRPRRPFSSSSSGVRGWWRSDGGGDFETPAKATKFPAAGEVEMGPIGAATAVPHAPAPPTEKTLHQPPPSSPPGGEGYEHDDGDAAEAARLAAEQAMAFYAARRTNDGQGVTIPSQRRYVHYFARVLARRWRQGKGGKDGDDDDNEEEDNSDGWAPRVVRVTVSGIPGLGAGGDGDNTTTSTNLALQLTFREAPRFVPQPPAATATDLEVKLYPPVAERTLLVPVTPSKDGAVVPAIVREGRRRGGAGLACLGSPAAMRRASASGAAAAAAAAAPLARVVTEEDLAVSVMFDANANDDNDDCATVVPVGGDVRFRIVAGAATQQPLLTAWLHPRLALAPPQPPSAAAGPGPYPAGAVRVSGRAQLDKLPRRLAGGGGGVGAGPSLEVAFEWVRRRRGGTLEASPVSVVDACPDSRPLGSSTGGTIEMRRMGAGG